MQLVAFAELEAPGRGGSLQDVGNIVECVVRE